jgi:hypothetical protein
MWAMRNPGERGSRDFGSVFRAWQPQARFRHEASAEAFVVSRASVVRSLWPTFWLRRLEPCLASAPYPAPFLSDCTAALRGLDHTRGGLPW